MLVLYAGKTRVEAPELEGKVLVIDPALVRDRRIDVIQVGGILPDVVAEIVALIRRVAGDASEV